ncbi:DUF3244 domain-containing protein [Marivirga arenosa]|uniref:DUF3244 domain-containing protein n=1 Tax=Marivirga arenosa TaxID=3059076 RepID=A0AA49GEM1_9BACT|nr:MULTISPECIES: DUF3244 domain-containing protein [unclassified Marivirga]WKK78927.2 DUF3244 domain-containing protein [Marivirga sp. BKB1-2]WKK86043.1 DUF3244 domain-containing protein [Marivirga sp. ABR2-2]
MKNLNIQKTVFAFFMMALPLMSFADGFPFVKLTTKENKLITLRVTSGESDFTNIKLKNQFGKVIYSETVKNENGILKNFDLKHLESGQYMIELENALNIEILPIKVTYDNVTVDKESFNTIYKPFIKANENGIVDFNFLNLNSKPASILIINNKGNVVYKEDLDKNLEIEKRYDLSSLEKGNYQFLVQTSDRNFKQVIAL